MVKYKWEVKTTEATEKLRFKTPSVTLMSLGVQWV
jgi:hypothetical protein